MKIKYFRKYKQKTHQKDNGDEQSDDFDEPSHGKPPPDAICSGEFNLVAQCGDHDEEEHVSQSHVVGIPVHGEEVIGGVRVL